MLFDRRTLLIPVLSLCVLAFSAPSRARVLPVPEVIQEQSLWCWAACSEAILDYYGVQAAQCAIAEWARQSGGWEGENCCTASGDCNRSNSLWGTAESIQSILWNWEISTSPVASPISPSDLEYQVENSRPILIRWELPGGNGHFLVVRGLRSKAVFYLDPWPGHGDQVAEYDWFVSGSSHTWTHTLLINESPEGPIGSSIDSVPAFGAGSGGSCLIETVK